jgi:hypothetical protein
MYIKNPEYSVKVHRLGSVYEVVWETKVTELVELWGLNGAWKDVDRVMADFVRN